MSVDVAQLGFRVESLEAEVAARRLDKMTGSAKRAATAQERLTKSALATSKAMKTMGRSMTLYLTAPLLAAAAASAKLGTNFDSTLTKINTLVGVSREEIAAFRKDILALGPAVGRGPIELADALFAITSAGQRGAEAMDTLRKSAMASAIGLGDTRVVALAATAAVQAYGKANLDSTKSLEILIGTIEKGNLEASALAPVLGRVIGIAAELGVAFEDLGAFIATFTLLGVNADEAATSLRGVLAAIQKPTPDALEAFEALGTSIDDVRRKIREDGFIVTFQELVRESRRLGVDLVALVPNVRALSGALGVFGGEGKIALDVLDGVSAAVGTLGERFAAMAEQDPSFAFAQMRAELEVMGIQIARDVLPAVLDIAQGIQGVAAAFGELNPETQRSIVKWGLLAAAMGPVLIVMGSMIRTLAVMVPGFIALHGAIVAKLLPAMRLFMIRMAGMAGSMGLLFGPVGLVLAGVAALGFLAFAMRDTEVEASELDKEIDALIESMEKFGQTAFDLAVGRVDMALAANAATVQNLTRSLNELQTAQGISAEAWRTDRIDLFNERLRVATEEGDHLREQLARLTQAKADLDAGLAQDELMARYAATMAELAKNMAFLDSLEITPAFDATAFNELVGALDPSIEATIEFNAALALLEEALKFKKINTTEFEKLKKLLQQSTLAVTAFGEVAKGAQSISIVTQAELEANFAYLDSLEALDEALRALEGQFDPLAAGLRDLADARELAQEGFDQGLLDEDELKRYLDGIDDMQSALEDLHSVWRNMLADSITALGEVADLFHEDSAAAEGLRSVMQILNVVMGVQAVIKQLAEGDVYSAIPRAIGVAALVASMGVQTGAAGSATATRTRQESQGTGSVLGDTDAKSESILKATEITASATSELVGINRGMLHALRNLQTGLTGAVTQLARGTGGDVPLPNTDNLLLDMFTGAGIFDLFGLNFVGDFLRSIFGGKVKLLDEGIQIEGGMLTDLMNETLARVFADIKIKKNILDDYDLKTKFADLDDEIGKQFTLVFQSIFDTVEQAAIAIGIPLDDIQERLASFEVETIKISTMDLTAEEQQEELLAVFSQIFDDLAGHVVPFIEDFQKVGEGLGETLVRVATSVQVMQEAILALGLSVDEMGPEAFARMSVDLVELTGGVEEFISKFTTFFDKFASEAQQLEFMTSQVERAFAEAGLEIPKTSAGMWELMQTLDATTEEGQAQIAMLLNISATAAEYYALLEDAEEDRLAQVLRLRAFMGDTVFSGLLDLRDDFNAAMKAADDLGASQREYVMIATAFNRRLKRMAAELTISVINMTQQLFGDELADTITGGLAEVREIANSVFEDWRRALEDIYDFTQSILLDEQLTTLTPLEQLNEAQSQFDALLAQAVAGDVEAAAQLPAAAQALLEEARFMFASGQRYEEIFDATLAALNNIQMPSGISPTITPEDDPTIVVETPEVPLTPNEILAEELQRFLQALDLAGVLRDLSQVLNTSVVGLAAELGVPLRELVTIMGIELEDISLATAAGLAEIALLLGADIFELMDALDIGLGDLLAELPEGIREDLGPLLDAIRQATTEADVTAGVDNLGAYVLGLPADLQLLLQPFLDWFTDPADTPELGALVGIEANTAEILAAIHALVGPIEAIPPLVEEKLPPVVIPPIIVQPPPVVVLPAVVPPIVIPPIIIPPPLLPPIVIRFPGVPPMQQYADGGSVDSTGPAMLHAGEFVVTKSADNLSVQTGDSEESGDMGQVLAVLVDIREQNRRYQDADLATSRDMESSLKTQTEQQRRIANV